MLSREQILKEIARFQKLTVVVAGDLFLDEYIETEMFEISKEGPFPVLRFESRTQFAGAAGNLASAIRGLGAQVSVVGIVGKDRNGQVILDQFRAKGMRTRGILIDPEKPTLTYTKFRARVPNAPSKEVFRMDVLPDGPLDAKREEKVLAALARETKRADAVILLDQIRHLISPRVLDGAPRLARKRKIPIQGSSRDHIGEFRGFDLITPNDREALGAVGGGREDIAGLGERLKRHGKHRKVILTLGPDGMALFPEKGPMARIPTVARQVIDVTGAGDAVSAAAVLGNVLGWDIETLGFTASCAAAVVIARVGTYHLTAADLARAVCECPEIGSPQP